MNTGKCPKCGEKIQHLISSVIEVKEDAYKAAYKTIEIYLCPKCNAVIK